jgi:hypothetical protein
MPREPLLGQERHDAATGQCRRLVEELGAVAVRLVRRVPVQEQDGRVASRIVRCDHERGDRPAIDRYVGHVARRHPGDGRRAHLLERPLAGRILEGGPRGIDVDGQLRARGNGRLG